MNAILKTKSNTVSNLLSLWLATSIGFSSLLYTQQSPASNTPSDLPILGDSISNTVSLDQEKRLGQAWLRALRKQSTLIDDPLLADYLKTISYRLISLSNLADKHLSLVIIDSEAINAFAVPGGIIGVNAGLFLNAETEGELAGVIAHEIAHLSQRHFARSLEEARKNQWLQGAALLASVLLIATSGSESGYAALATTQAAAVQAHLNFSRRNEQEADRLAIQTLADANIDPMSVSRFFERMQKAHQYLGQKPPEYLLTHPVTESRIADARARANSYPTRFYDENLEFQLMKARVEAKYSKKSIPQFKAQLSALKKTNTIKQLMLRYTLANMLINAQRYTEAEQQLNDLLKYYPQRLSLLITQAEIKLGNKDYVAAEKILSPLHETNPDNPPITLMYCKSLSLNKKAKKAARILETFNMTHKDSPAAWKQLAQTYGKTGNIIGVHQARAEYLYLSGKTDRAIEQLEFALALISNDFPLIAKVETRRELLIKSKEELRL